MSKLPLSFLISGLIGMTLFFTTTAVFPAIFPWERQAKTLEQMPQWGQTLAILSVIFTTVTLILYKKTLPRRI